jgi:N-acyl-D-aspartate/D-glutamate deacylase
MHDLVIRNASLVDGTGAPQRVSDIAIDEKTISEVGSDLSAGKREIDAEGLLLAPGWVDIHTHYDGQATWDPYLAPSSWHGVTTSVFGNCGVGFAPVRPGAERFLINLMEGVEDIPETVLAEGIDFTWESFPQYLDALEKMPRIMDIGAQVPHCALRFYVMGERGADHAEVPTDAEIAEMGVLLEQSLRAGALGFTTSRTIKHKAKDGRYTPGLTAMEPELAGLALAMKRAGSGVIEVNSDFGDGDFEKLRAAAELAQRPLSVLLLQVHNAPNVWKDTLAGITNARARGQNVTGQVGSRPIGILWALEGTVHPLITHPLWIAMSDLKPAERVMRINSNAELRRKLWQELPNNEHTQWIRSMLPRTFRLEEPINYEPDPQHSVAALAQAAQRDPIDFSLEWLLEKNGKAILMNTYENYFDGNLDIVGKLLADPGTICGIADAGAHVGFICDAGSATSMLTHWTRDRKRGLGLPLEYLIKKQTFDTARTYGLNDRGVIAPGYRADFNLIDFDALRVTLPELIYDLPAGGKRMIQRAEGYRHTFVAGTEVMANGEVTGALPGRLIRGEQKI